MTIKHKEWYNTLKKDYYYYMDNILSSYYQSQLNKINRNAKEITIQISDSDGNKTHVLTLDKDSCETIAYWITKQNYHLYK